MSPLRKVFGFIFSATHSRTMGILIFFILLVAVSLTVIVSQQQQQLRQQASYMCENTSIPECPSELKVTPGDACTAGPDFKCRVGNTIFGCRSTTKDNNEFN